MSILNQLNWFDYVLVGIVLLSLFIGLARGMLREFLSLGTWIISILIAVLFTHRLAQSLNQHIHPPILSTILSFVFLFLITFIIGTLVNYIVSGLFDRTRVPFIDRFLGALFGLVRGAMIALLVLFVVANIGFKESDWFTSSMSSKHVGYLNDLYLRYVDPMLEKAKQETKQATQKIAAASGTQKVDH